MKNWRRILVTGLVAGMVAVTGCSSNLPETNQGNRNGQRVVDAVNRRTDTYGATRARNTGARTVRGYNRGFRRAARTGRDVGPRYHGTYAHPGLGHSANRHHTGSGTTTRNIPNRSTATHNRGRVGHTFGYGQYGYMDTLDNEYGGYDLGRRAGTHANNNVTRSTQRQNAAIVNNRVVRNSPVGNGAVNNTPVSRATRRATGTKSTGVTRSTGTKNTGVTRSTHATPNKTAAKAVQPTRNTTRKTSPTRSTRSNQHSVRPANTVRSIANANNATRGSITNPMLHNTNNIGAVRHANTARPTPNRHGTRRLSARADRARELHTATRENRLPNVQNAQATPFANTGNIVNPSATRGITRARSLQNSPNRSARRATTRRASNVASNRASRGLGQGMNYGYDRYGNDSAYNTDGNSYDAYGYGDIYGGASFTGFSGTAGDVSHTVPASASDDNTDYAFFKRNKTDDNAGTTPTPAPPSGPQVPTRSNRMSPAQPAPSPAPTSMGYNYDYDNIHDIDDDTADYDSDYGSNPGNTSPTPPAHRTAQHRLTK